MTIFDIYQEVIDDWHWYHISYVFRVLQRLHHNSDNTITNYNWSTTITRKNKSIDNKTFAVQAAKIAQDRHCTDIVVLDLRGKSPATEYFVIATGTSDRQARTVTDEIQTLAKQNGFVRFGQAGYKQGRWILIDYIDIVIHIFDEQYREYYDLEMLWGDAEKLKIE